MEGNVDTGERNRREASLQLNIALALLQLLSFLVGVVDDFSKHLLDLIDGEGFGELDAAVSKIEQHFRLQR